jgi:hypothetical protein
MTVPGRVAAAALLRSLDPPPWFVHHARAVGEIAGWLAARVEARLIPVDRRLVEAAGLLHDVDKLLPPADPLRRLPHGEAGAAWLARQGHPELRAAVAHHPVTRLADDIAFEAWLATASVEDQIVAYADKRAGQRLESMADRFASWSRRYPAGWPEEPPGVVERNAARLEARVCGLARITPQQVSRLRWTGPALRAARAMTTTPRAPRSSPPVERAS